METLLANGFVLQNAATSGNGTAADLKGHSRELSFYLKWSTGVTSGAIQLETADDVGYLGTWAPLGAPIASASGNRTDVVQVTGSFKAVRARVSTTVAGGTVTVRLFGN